MRFTVSLDVVPRIPHVVEVEADDQLAATEKAIELVLYELNGWVEPLNGNYVEMKSDDISVDWVDEVKE